MGLNEGPGGVGAWAPEYTLSLWVAHGIRRAAPREAHTLYTMHAQGAELDRVESAGVAVCVETRESDSYGRVRGPSRLAC